MAAVCDGHGASLSFGSTSGFTGRMRNIGALRRYRDAIDDTALADSNERFCPGKLLRSDEMEFEFIADPDTDTSIFLGADAETMTIQYPPGEGETNGATRTFSGFITSISDPSLATSENLIGNMTIRPTGPITVTPGT